MHLSRVCPKSFLSFIGLEVIHSTLTTETLFCFDSTESVYWPMFVVATGAAIVGSQATISGTYSIIKQAVAHGCFPRVKIVHTSKKFIGQIYCPDVNWILMLGCIAVTASFRNQSQIGNAYGKTYRWTLWFSFWIKIIVIF